MPTVEERLAAIEKQMTAWMDQRPTTYYTHQYSGEEIDAAVGRALTGGALDTSVTNVSNQLGTFVRPNLLDNAYFGNPVDQLGGHIVLQGKMAYRDAECTIEAGGVSETAMAVTKVSDTVYTFKGGDGNPYYVKAADVVRGYTGNWIYTIDRWHLADADGSLEIHDGYITYKTSSYFFQPISADDVKQLIGMTVTLSFIYADGTLDTGTCNITSWSDEWTVFLETGNIRIVGIQNGRLWALCTAAGKGMVAAKLELGPTQTLAHQDAAGNWVLNEVPEYGGQLRRCLRHDYIIGSNTEACPICVGTAYSSDSVVAVVDLPEVMRTNPAVSISGAIQIRFSATQNLSVSTVANYGFSGDKVQLYFSGLSGLTPGQSCDLYTQSGSKIEFNANL